MRKDAHAPTYRSWQMMKNRCLNPKATDFAYYGGKGITVPSKWLTYEGFIADMGLRPEGLTLDRKDGTKSYSKNNCRWASRLVQSRNREYVLNLTYQGQTRTPLEWAELLGLSFHGFHSRLHLKKTGRMSEAQVFAKSTRYRRNRELV